jgi:hypothetical protein
MFQISYIDNTGNQDNVIVVNLEDKYANECLQLIQSMKQKELDGEYWTYRSLTFQTNNNQIKTIDIYPLAPFLAQGEEIIWHQMKTEGIRHKKVLWIEALTN